MNHIPDDHLSASDTLITGQPLDDDIMGESCPLTEIPGPCTIVIFGATGDLSNRKLAPALYNLHRHGRLPAAFAMVGVGRKDLTDSELRDMWRESAQNLDGFSRSDWDKFAGRIHYQAADYQSESSMTNLAERLTRLDREHQTRGNRLFYLAVPPSAYGQTAGNLGRSGLSAEHESGNGWSRIVVEKPFGHDLASARQLNRELGDYFTEAQIFRIDHYMAKETVQSLLMFRFANAIFEPVWNRQFVDFVRIIAAEQLGVEKRAAYYEHAGVLRDMFQNHMLQLLSLCAMEPPAGFTADWVRDEKTKVFKSLRPFPVDHLDDYLVLGQYRSGQIDGKPVPGYRDEPGISDNSLTPTYAAMKVFVDNWRWQGVPFFITSGKRLNQKVTQIVFNFKRVPHSLFRPILSDSVTANQLILNIFPRESMHLTFQTKTPGAEPCLRRVRMNFDYLQGYSGPTFESYEKALLDCLVGAHMLFWREEDVELAWNFINPVIQACETCAEPARRLRFYEAGSWGPSEVKQLLESEPGRD